MKTKLFSLMLAVAASMSMWASDTEVDGIWYNFNSSTQTASVAYRGSNYNSYSDEYSGSVVIPSSVTYNGATYSVTSIGYYAFRSCSSLTSVTIPNSVKSIGDGAFYGCSSLTSVTIPNSVTSIGTQAFSDCNSLTSVTIGNSVTSIEEKAFASCSSLTSVTIPNSVTSIGGRAFSYVPNIVYSGTATGSPWGARSMNGYVDGYLVYSDASKTELLACSAAAIGEITIPNSVTSIGDEAFSYCSSLTSVTIPNSVTSIEEKAFASCSSITSVTIPNSVTSIGDEAFSYCSSITSVTIPNSVTSIGEGAFYYCSNLTSITIPNSVTSIGKYAFTNCSSLTSVTIPNSVTSIGYEAFASCSSLTSVTIPNSVTSIGERAFSSCENLETVILGNGLISLYRFAFYNCIRIIDIYCYAERVPDVDYNPDVEYDPFYNVSRKAYLWVPANRLRNYQTDSFWGEFDVRAMEDEGVTVTEVQVIAGKNSADIVWPTNNDASTYEFVITKDGEVICTLIFNANGQLTSIAFAPARHDNNRAPEQTEQSGFSFTVTGLNPGTTYSYTLTTKDASDKVLDIKTGTFTTEGITAVENLLSQEELQSMLQNPATRIYNLQGNELTAMRDNLPAGVYILRLGDKAGKVVIR